MKLYFLITASFCIAFSSCNKIDELTNFTVDFEQEATIPASTVVDLPIDIISPPMETKYEETYSEYNTAVDLIESVKLNQIKISLKAPEGGNFDYLKSAELYLMAEGLETIKLAGVTDVPEGLTELELDVDSDADLKAYYESGEITSQIKAETDQLISEEQTINTFIQIKIDAKILGV